jgi:hypothetical protein
MICPEVFKSPTINIWNPISPLMPNSVYFMKLGVPILGVVDLSLYLIIELIP